MHINLIAAISNQGGLGFNGTIPWKCNKDMKFFKKTTIGNKENAIIMGRKTWESLPEPKILPNRYNVVISKTSYYSLNQKYSDNNNIIFVENVVKAMEDCLNKNLETVWVIGGLEIYKYFLDIYSNILSYCYITNIDTDIECDVFFPELDKKVWKIDSEQVLSDKAKVVIYKKISYHLPDNSS
tara:strand:- start:1542 stop:2090 length:549 start_codon:yes stop_codon:yes gene_type:complete